MGIVTTLRSNSLVLKKEAENFFETMLRFYQTIRQRIPEYSNSDSHLISPFVSFFLSFFFKFAAMILCPNLVAGGLNFSMGLRLFPIAVSRRTSPRKERLFIRNKRCRIAPTTGQFVLRSGRKRVPCGADWLEKVTLSEQ